LSTNAIEFQSPTLPNTRRVTTKAREGATGQTIISRIETQIEWQTWSFCYSVSRSAEEMLSVTGRTEISGLEYSTAHCGSDNGFTVAVNAWFIAACLISSEVGAWGDLHFGPRLNITINLIRLTIEVTISPVVRPFVIIFISATQRLCLEILVQIKCIKIYHYIYKLHPYTIDMKTVVFRCPWVVWQFQTPIYFPAVKLGLILKYEAEKALVWMSSMSESHWWYLFYKEVKSWDSTTWFRIWQFQTPP
jgi:hypothetical protein